MKLAIHVGAQFRTEMSGIQRYVDALLGELAKPGGSSELVAYAPSAAAAKDGASESLHGRGVELDVDGSAATRLLGHLTRHGRRLSNAHLRLETYARTRRFDLLHVPDPRCFGYQHSGARRACVTIYDLSTRLHPSAFRPEWLPSWEQYYAFARNRCDRVITISESARRDIVEHLDIAADRIDVTPLAARRGACPVQDGPGRRRLLAALGLDGPAFVLYAGTLEPRKNLPMLVQAFADAVRDQRDPDTLLVLAGGVWGDHGRELQTLAESLGIGGRLRLTGYVPDETMNALMSACRLFAYVSLYEGFGLPPLEAMLCGAPVLVSNASSLPEVVGDAGLQVDPADRAQMASGIASLLSDEAERSRRIEASLARAETFSWARTATLTEESYARSLAG